MEPKQGDNTKKQIKILHELQLQSHSAAAHSPEPQAFATTPIKEKFQALGSPSVGTV